MDAFYEVRQYDTDLKVWCHSYENIGFLPHWHAEVEFIIIKKGTLKVTVDENTVIAKKGDLIVCDSGDIHYSDSSYMDNFLDFLIFDPSIIDHLFSGFNLNTPLLTKEKLLELDLYDHLIKLFKVIKNEVHQQQSFYEKIITSSLTNFCFLLHRKTQNIKRENKYNKHKQKIYQFQKLLQFIDENYDRDLSLEYTARKMNLSNNYFSSFFKEYTGYNFVSYVNSIRIEKAILDLTTNTDDTITDIAFAHGFNSIRTFNRVFKKITQLTPSEFKNRGMTNTSLYSAKRSAQIKQTKKFKNNTLLSK